MYAIRRHRASINAWCWRVCFRRKGRLFERSFYDGKLGGEEEALRAATAWRDRQLREIEALSLIEFHSQVRANNSSGIPGVHFHKTASQPLGFWQASLRVSGLPSKSRSFSVLKFGYANARSLAERAREQMLAEVTNHPYLSAPEALEAVRAANSTDGDARGLCRE